MGTEDIPLLAQAFVDQLASELKRKVRSLAPDAVKLLVRYPWPGNVRELRNTIERAVILGAGERIEVADLPSEVQPGRLKPGSAESLVTLPPEGVKLGEIEHELVRKALDRTRGNQSAAARLLGITRDQLRYRMEQMGLLAPPPKRRAAPDAR